MQATIISAALHTHPSCALHARAHHSLPSRPPISMMRAHSPASSAPAFSVPRSRHCATGVTAAKTFDLLVRMKSGADHLFRGIPRCACACAACALHVHAWLAACVLVGGSQRAASAHTWLAACVSVGGRRRPTSRWQLPPSLPLQSSAASGSSAPFCAVPGGILGARLHRPAGRCRVAGALGQEGQGAARGRLLRPPPPLMHATRQ